MLVLRILLLLQTYLVLVLHTAEGDQGSKWHLVKTVKNTKSGILMKNNGKVHGEDYEEEHGKKGESTIKYKRMNNNKKQIDLDRDIDQSCSTSAECYTKCKLCAGYGHYGPWSMVHFFCLCQKGTCKRIDRENMEPNSPGDRRTLCLKNGECFDTFEDQFEGDNGDWKECNGECIKYGTPCDGKCPNHMCRKGNKCIAANMLWKTCNGKCIGRTETCDGKCDYNDCLMNNGSCFNLNWKSRIWKKCKGKCIKSNLKCDGSCSWGQCEMDDGTCTYTTNFNEENVYQPLKFGICAGHCVDIVTNTSIPACHGQCEPIPDTRVTKLEKGICHLDFMDEHWDEYDGHPVK